VATWIGCHGSYGLLGHMTVLGFDGGYTLLLHILNGEPSL